MSSQLKCGSKLKNCGMVAEQKQEEKHPFRIHRTLIRSFDCKKSWSGFYEIRYYKDIENMNDRFTDGTSVPQEV